MSISVSQLSRKYGEQTAVDRISFEVPTGQVVGFLGPNGAGKSTTMKMLTGYLPPTQGEAVVNGTNVVKDPIAVKRSIGYLPEHNPLYTEMYVREFLRFVGELSGIRKGLNQKVEEVIGTTGLTPEANKRIQELSKGYRQRVGLAQALIHDPQVLILDEPTSGLDPNQVREIRDLIRGIGKDRTVMLSTHIMQEVEAMCDRVIIIHKGAIVADDQLAALKQRFTEPRYRVQFKEEVDLGDLEKIPAVLEARKEEEQVLLKLDPELQEGIEEALFAWAVEHKQVILSQKRLEDNLESLFRKLTMDG